MNRPQVEVNCISKQDQKIIKFKFKIIIENICKYTDCKMNIFDCGFCE